MYHGNCAGDCGGCPGGYSANDDEKYSALSSPGTGFEIGYDSGDDKLSYNSDDSNGYSSKKGGLNPDEKKDQDFSELEKVADTSPEENTIKPQEDNSSFALMTALGNSQRESIVLPQPEDELNKNIENIKIEAKKKSIEESIREAIENAKKDVEPTLFL